MNARNDRLYRRVGSGTSQRLRCHVLVVAVSLLVGGGGVAAAQEDTLAAERRALVLFEAAELRFREGRHREAITLLEEAWSLHHAPAILFNMGRAHEELGERDDAIDAYRRYLEADPDSQARAGVQERIRELERERASAAGTVPSTRDEAGPGSRVELPVSEPAAHARGPAAQPAPSETEGVALGPWVVMGAGVVVLGAGGVLGLLSRTAHTDAETNPVHLEARESYRHAESLALVANISFVAGGVLAAVGLVWILWPRGDVGDVALSIGPGTVAVRGWLP